jgi:Oxidoreductase family, NAD-binding Rossmann fold
VPFHPAISEASDIKERLRRDQGRGIAAAGGWDVRARAEGIRVGVVGASITGFAETGDGRRKAEHGLTAYADVEDALPHVDALVVVTPPTSHAGLVPQAIAAGQHVLIEKPRTRVNRCVRPRVAHERKTTHANRAE